jgi:hypothetical protein
MANEMPPGQHTGLARKVLQYSENFLRIVDKIKPLFRESDWAPLEELVYEFNSASKLLQLDVYVAPILKRSGV